MIFSFVFLFICRVLQSETVQVPEQTLRQLVWTLSVESGRGEVCSVLPLQEVKVLLGFFFFFFGKTGVKGPDEVLRDVHTKELLTVSTVASSVCN